MYTRTSVFVLFLDKNGSKNSLILGLKWLKVFAWSPPCLQAPISQGKHGTRGVVGRIVHPSHNSTCTAIEQGETLGTRQAWSLTFKSPFTFAM